MLVTEDAGFPCRYILLSGWRGKPHGLPAAKQTPQNLGLTFRNTHATGLHMPSDQWLIPSLKSSDLASEMPPWPCSRTFCFILPLTACIYYLQVSPVIVNKWNDLCLCTDLLPVTLHYCRKLSCPSRILGRVEGLVHTTEGVISWLSHTEWKSQEQDSGLPSRLTGLVISNIQAPNHYCRGYSSPHYTVSPGPQVSSWGLESDIIAPHCPLQWPLATCGQRAHWVADYGDRGSELFLFIPFQWL